MFSDLGQGRFGHAVFNETHGRRPSLLDAIRNAGMGQRNMDHVVLPFPGSSPAGNSQTEIRSGKATDPLGQPPGHVGMDLFLPER
jgi:hypothetical protein